MKYYLYISKTKVDMLYPQIPSSVLKRISADLKISFGVVSTTVRTPEAGSLDDVYSKVAVLDTYLRSHEDVGSVEDPGTVQNPKPYIAGTLSLGRGTLELEDGSDKLACFAGRFGPTRLVMIGAVDSLVGKPIRAESSHNVDDYGSAFLFWMKDEALRYGAKPSRKERKDIENDAEGVLDADDESLGYLADWTIHEVSDRVQRLEFLAWVLYYREENIHEEAEKLGGTEKVLFDDSLEEENGSRRIVIASPIYVAVDERSNRL